MGGGEFDVDEEVRGASGGGGGGAKGSTGKEKVRSWDEGDIGEFRPERWLVPDGSGRGEVVFDVNAGPAMPMSAGPRGCFGMSWLVCMLMMWNADTVQGKRLAHLELRLAIVTLVLAFEFLGVSDALDTDNATEIMTRQPDTCFVRLRMVD